MNMKRKIEVFSAGCPVCEEKIQMINRTADSSCCEVSVLDMKDQSVARRAKELGIRSVPAVVIDGQLSGCYACPIPDDEMIRAANEFFGRSRVEIVSSQTR